MSPRAAWRLDQLGYQAYDYVGGKMDWLSFGLAYEGKADLVVDHVQPARSIRPNTSIAEAREELSTNSLGILVVTNEHDVVLGLLRQDDLQGLQGLEDDEVSTVMREGPTTVRPSEERAELAHRLQHAGTGFVLVTRSDGTLLGAFVT